MKFNVTNILLGVLIMIMGWKVIFPEPIPDPAPITVQIPEQVGTSGTQIIERVKVVTVAIPSQDKPVSVDADLKEAYEKSKDSIEKLNLYLESIRVRDYNSTLVDNDTIKITGKGRVRGQLLDYKIDWKIKESAFTYTPEVVVREPKLSLKGGLEFGIPKIIPDSDLNSGFVAKANLRFVNRKGNSLSVGADTEKRIWIGGEFTIFKTRR